MYHSICVGDAGQVPAGATRTTSATVLVTETVTTPRPIKLMNTTGKVK